MVAASELPINTSASALQMAQTIFGDGTTVSNASYSSSTYSSGIYSNGNTEIDGFNVTHINSVAVSAGSFEQEITAQIYNLFSEIVSETGLGYSPAARRTLRPYEAQLWCALEAKVA